MTPSDAYNFIINKLHIAASEYSNLLQVFNFKMYDIAGAIAIQQDDYFGYRYMDGHLVGSTRIYEIPQDILNRVSGIEVQLDGTTWQPVTIKKMTDIKDYVYSETWITEHYSNQYPHGFIYGKYFYLLSGQVAAVTRGLRWWYKAMPKDVPTMAGTTDLSITTDPTGTLGLGIPKQFHELWCRAVMIDFKDQNKIPLTMSEAKYDDDLTKKLSELTPLQEDEEVQGSIPDNDGSDY